MIYELMAHITVDETEDDLFETNVEVNSSEEYNLYFTAITKDIASGVDKATKWLTGKEEITPNEFEQMYKDQCAYSRELEKQIEKLIEDKKGLLAKIDKLVQRVYALTAQNERF